MLSLPACAEAAAGLFFVLVRRSLGEGGSKHARRWSESMLARSPR